MKAKKSTTAATAIMLAGGSLAVLAAIAAGTSTGRHRRGSRRPLPGDDLIADSKLDSTHAITIRAPAERIWPGLAQMGYEDRAAATATTVRAKHRPKPLPGRPAYPALAAGDAMPFYPARR